MILQSLHHNTIFDQHGQVVTVTYCPRCTASGTSIAREQSTVGTDEQSLRSEVTVAFSQTSSSTSDLSQTAPSTVESETSVTSNSYSYVSTTTTDKDGHTVTITYCPKCTSTTGAINSTTGKSLGSEVTTASSNPVSVSQIQYSSLTSSVSEVSVPNVAVSSSSSSSSTASSVPNVESYQNSGNGKLYLSSSFAILGFSAFFVMLL
ncbi:unnamed protein product [Ambrosiozyma monospora]|uniref:Unnamed protein product n=1 Tax=Ambrosiozyma monospora TaxID=43982 RepID=A0ACB5T8M5_AMBMO|nr:unnamed protein product [Ambrosiozyma monospora]